MFVDNERELKTPPPQKKIGVRNNRGNAGAGFHAIKKVKLRSKFLYQVPKRVGSEAGSRAYPGRPALLLRDCQTGHAGISRTQGPSTPRPQMVTSQFISEKLKGARKTDGAEGVFGP